MGEDPPILGEAGSYQSPSNVPPRAASALAVGTACVEEAALFMNFIDAAQVRKLAEPLKKSGYGQYLLGLVGG